MNFTPSEQGMRSRLGDISTVDVVNAAAMESWESNTGRQYTLKGFLRPFAKELSDLLEGSNVQFCTITCSPEIIEVIHEIKNEEAARERSNDIRSSKRDI